ncbi:MAG: hypothetical protein V4702_06390 [Patescibacteria group bacterium]
MSYDQEINVTSYYFNASRCFPRAIEVEGQSLSFLETGLRCLVQKGQSLVQIFNMTDGHKLYRLSFEPGNRTWKLLSSRSL